MSIYKACDIRGHYGKELSDLMAYKIGKAVGTLLPEKRVVVAGDVRISTPSLKEQLIRGLLETACDVVDIGIVPTPVFYFAKNFLKIDGGVMVTASHNPAEYNGFKLTLSEWPITTDEMDQIKSKVETGDFLLSKRGKFTKKNLLQEYEIFIKNTLVLFDNPSSQARRLKIVIDCGNGCYSRVAPKIFRQHGYEVVELFCTEDGRFPDRNPNPSVIQHLSALSSQVIQEKADFGIAFDGDGDRVVFVDQSGTMIENDKMIALFARHLLVKYPGTKMVHDIKCSGLVRDEIKKAGGQSIMEKSGHAYIKTTLLKENAIFGGEVSGHFFFRAVHGDDGLFAALLMGQILQESARSLAQLVADFPPSYITPDIRIPYHQKNAPILLEQLASRLEKDGECEVSRLDGVRGEFPIGWGLVRISVTEPLLTFRFEAHSLSHLNTVKDRFLEPVSQLHSLVNAVWEESVRILKQNEKEQ